MKNDGFAMKLICRLISGWFILVNDTNMHCICAGYRNANALETGRLLVQVEFRYGNLK